MPQATISHPHRPDAPDTAALKPQGFLAAVRRCEGCGASPATLDELEHCPDCEYRRLGADQYGREVVRDMLLPALAGALGYMNGEDLLELVREAARDRIEEGLPIVEREETVEARVRELMAARITARRIERGEGSVTCPAVAISRFSEGLRYQLGHAAFPLQELLEARDSPQNRDATRAALEKCDQLRALLDLLDWGAATGDVEIPEPLIPTLHDAVRTEVEDLSEGAEEARKEAAIMPDHPECAEYVRKIEEVLGALQTLLATLDGRDGGAV